MKSQLHKILSAIMVTIYISWIALPGAAYAVPAPQAENATTATTNQELERGYNPETGKVSFIRGESPIQMQGLGALTATTPQDRALNFLAIYGKEFGLQNPLQELEHLKSQTDEKGNNVVHYQQIHHGVPVIAAELIVNMNASGDLLSISGEVSSGLTLNTAPAIEAQDAYQTAIGEIAKIHNLDEMELTATQPELWIFDESTLKASTRPVELVWRVEVTAKDATQPIREMVLVNAQMGEMSLHINQVDTSWKQKTVVYEDKSSDKFETTDILHLQQTALPLYFDLVIDNARGWIYGSDSTGNKVDVIDMGTLQLVKSFTLVNGASPKGMDFDPVSDELAVAQNGGGSVLFIDPDTGTMNLAIVGGKPFDVIYGRNGRLYSAGSGGASDYIHIIDSTAYVEVAKSSYAIYSNPRLAISSDKNYLYANMTYTDVIYKFDVTSDTIQNPISSSRYGLYADYFILAPDDSKFITDRGQVWSSDLKGQIGSLGSGVGQTVYLPMHDAIATAVDDSASNDRVIFSSADSFYTLSTFTLPVQGKVGPLAAPADGSQVFVSTDKGLVSIDLSSFPPGMPGTLPNGSLPYTDLVIDESRNLLYGSNTSGHKIDILSMSTLEILDEIRLNNNTRPMGMDIRPDGNELAVALNGASSLAFINLNTRSVSATIIVDTTSYNVPFDVKYGRAGRLYSTGNPQSSGTGSVYIFDVNSYTNVGKANELGVRSTPYLSISSDNNTLFTIDTADPNRLCRYDISTDTIPPRTCGILDTYDDDFSYILLKDGSKIFTGNGKVWTSTLNAQLGSFSFLGHMVEIPGKNVVAGVSRSSPGTIIFVRKSDFYTASTYTMPAPGSVGPSVANADGSKLFVNTQSGIKVIDVAVTSPISVSMASGSSQTAHVLATFGSPLKTKVQNLYGEPLAGIEVTFSAPGTGASGMFVDTNSNVSTVVTDVNGIAVAPAFVANNLGGTYFVSAAVANLPTPANFQLTNIPPAILVSNGSLQSTQVFTTFVDPLRAVVQYAPGEPIAGVEVTFTAPTSGASGTFSDTGSYTTKVLTDGNGIATAPAFTANSTSGSFVVKASIPDVAITADFQLTNLASISCFVSNGTGSPSLFNPYKQYNCGKTADAVGVGDFNNDGRKDVALSARVGTGSQSALLIFIQDDDGKLTQPRVHAGGNRAESLAVGDLNHDGLDDVVTGDFSDNKISVFIQKTAGVFAPRVTYIASTGPNAIAIGDINNDGRNDVTLSHSNSAMIGVFIQKEDGTLHPMTTYPSADAGYDDIAIGDVNSDGRNDVVKMNGQGYANPHLQVYLQGLNGILSTAIPYSMSCSSCSGSGLGIGDVTGDGRSDVVVTYGGNKPSSNIAVFEQGANGTLQPSISYPAYDIPESISIADVNLDGLGDAVAVHSGWLQVGVFLQSSNGTLGTEMLYTLPNYYPEDLDIGDINGDDLPDLVIADNLGLVVIHRNTNPTSTPTPGPGPSPTPRASATSGPSPTPVPPSSTGSRRTYTASGGSTLPGSLLCDETQSSCTNGTDIDADEAHRYAADTFVFYNTHHGRNSIDNAGGTIISTVNYGINYQNAFWNHSQVVYGDNMAADDVVGHEITHGVTEYTSGLIYYGQSGAINESFSDVWGELIDQTNGSGNDELAVKWLVGEDSALGVIRSMKNPPAYGDPDKVSSPYFYIGNEDNGGVHINSGVNNKAAYLMVEGGTFNGRTIIAIGLNKTAAIYYETQVNHLTMGANYNDLYYALTQACQNLVGGVNGITQNDCEQVQIAAEAVEMILSPSTPPTVTVVPPTWWPSTATGTPTKTPTTTFTPSRTPTSSATGTTTNTPTAVPTYDSTVIPVGDILRASVDSGGVQGNGDTYFPAISADGRYIVFNSHASNLVPGDTNGVSDIFVHDMQTSQTARVSMASDGMQGNGHCYHSAISADGRYIAFDSDSSNLVAGDTNASTDVFVHDRQTGITTLLSVRSNGWQGSGTSLSPSISADGRYIAFYSSAANLVENDTNLANDIFLHDRQTGKTRRISEAFDGTPTNNDSHYPSISADGRYIAFESEATNLIPGDTNGVMDIFRYDSLTGQILRVSVDSYEMQANGYSGLPSITADGSLIAFESSATNLVSDDTNTHRDIFLHNTSTGTTTRVSVDSNGLQSDHSSYGASISGNGRYIAFDSAASNLVPGNSTRQTHAFVHDRELGKTTRFSVSSIYGLGNGHSNQIVVSADGQFLAFTSWATNLVPYDTNLRPDIFVYRQSILPLPLTPTPASKATASPTGTVTATQASVSTITPSVTSTPVGTNAPSTSFKDVPDNYWASSFIERLYDAGITGGCGNNNYCPGDVVTRAQMAVFLLRSVHGSSYAPPAVGDSTGFEDVQPGYWAAAWIKQLAAEGITSGCGPGKYCPESPVTRAEMAIFLLRSKYGTSYSPPGVDGNTGFTDVEPGYWAAAWIKQLVAEGITAGCGNGNYCPASQVTRAQMAVFLVRAFNLP